MERFKHKFNDSKFSNRDFKIGYRKLETFFFITPKPQINAFLYTTLREQFMHRKFHEKIMKTFGVSIYSTPQP